METFLIIGGVVVLVIATSLYHRQRERDLLQRLEQSGRDPALAISELDHEIEQNRETSEFWKKQSGKRL